MNQQIFKEIQTLKRRILPNEKMILFGSQARGDAREDSDWDLLVLLNKSHKELSDEDKAFQFVLAGWKYGAYFSIKKDFRSIIKQFETTSFGSILVLFSSYASAKD